MACMMMIDCILFIANHLFTVTASVELHIQDIRLRLQPETQVYLEARIELH
jgi:hypothetical protein